ncbi:metalloregulator ArsR/SmtB family transcription factor [Microbacterium sp. ET2]|uniref:metalloregulator ArsR/SmtB family transcription factor n=1 Tax=Microbacterium albipurpureum TaxID=3050384 RepID=UPI00259CA929|nr:metalloregulator ArsR/SmtB family transcription factor [Microbacterium sp. ET2 (Ac-2212)]WJL96890.1 metalloregulator ArsR/SmtB family transcription factor [Microbacterium sp. ET2 (Ac-2212)]
MGTGTDDAGLTLLADPTRARIVRMMRDSTDGRVLVGRLAEALGLRQPTVSHHMAALHAEGIVRREKEGRRVWYSLDAAQEDRVSALLGPATPAGDADLSRVVDDLTARYRGVFSPETVARYVTDSHRMLTAAGRPALEASRTASFAASRLDDLTRIEGHAPDRPSVLFVCVQNAGRSQIAAGILRQLAGDRVIVRTAGSAPAADVRSSIVHALDEIGVPIGGEFPKPLSDEAVRAADWVITMGCGDACPVYPGRRYLDWDLEDPVGKPAATVRRIRDDIESRVRDLLPELVETSV